MTTSAADIPVIETDRLTLRVPEMAQRSGDCARRYRNVSTHSAPERPDVTKPAAPRCPMEDVDVHMPPAPARLQ